MSVSPHDRLRKASEPWNHFHHVLFPTEPRLGWYHHRPGEEGDAIEGVAFRPEDFHRKQIAAEAVLAWLRIERGNPDRPAVRQQPGVVVTRTVGAEHRLGADDAPVRCGPVEARIAIVRNQERVAPDGDQAPDPHEVAGISTRLAERMLGRSIRREDEQRVPDLREYRKPPVLQEQEAVGPGEIVGRIRLGPVDDHEWRRIDRETWRALERARGVRDLGDSIDHCGPAGERRSVERAASSSAIGAGTPEKNQHAQHTRDNAQFPGVCEHSPTTIHVQTRIEGERCRTRQSQHDEGHANPPQGGVVEVRNLAPLAAIHSHHFVPRHDDAVP